MLVPRTVLSGLARIADIELSCYVLGGVRLERTPNGAPLAIATDGRRMIVATWRENVAEELPLPENWGKRTDAPKLVVAADACFRLAKLAEPNVGLLKCKPEFGYVAIDESCASVDEDEEAPKEVPAYAADGNGQRVLTNAAVLDGRYPNWSTCYPGYNSSNSVSVCLNANYLAEIAEVLAQYCNGQETAPQVVLTIASNDDGEAYTKAVVLSAKGVDGKVATAVLMPTATRDGKEYVKPSLCSALEAAGGEPAEAEAVEAEPVEAVEAAEPAEAEPAEAEPAPPAEAEAVEAEPAPPAEAAAGRSGRLELAPRLRKLADGMQAFIDGKREHRLENTPKRHYQAKCGRIEADHHERAQNALRLLADLHEAGAVPPELLNVTTKKQALALTATYHDTSGGYRSIQDTHELVDTSPAAVKLAEAVEAAKTAADRKADADREYAGYVAKIEEGVKFCPIPGFYPTPPALADRMIAKADLHEGLKVLEPSAGKGDLAERIAAIVGRDNVTLCEVNRQLVALLEAKGFGARLVSGDFLERFTVTETGRESAPARFDRVILNPPFERGADVPHVMLAYDLLVPGGRLVAIMGAVSAEHRLYDWLTEHEATVDRLPADTFKGVEVFRSTGAVACLVIIDKPAEAEPVPPAEAEAVEAEAAGPTEAEPVEAEAVGPAEAEAVEAEPAPPAEAEAVEAEAVDLNKLFAPIDVSTF